MSDENQSIALNNDEERRRRQEIKRSRSVEGMEKRWQDQDREALQEKAAQYAPPVVSEPRCHVCFLPGSLVRTEDGFKPIQDIAVGEYIDDGNGSIARVNHVMSRQYSGEVFGLRTHGTLRPIWMTPEHPLSVVVGDHKRSDRINACIPFRCASVEHYLEWQRVDQIDLESYVSLTKPYIPTVVAYTHTFDLTPYASPGRHLPSNQIKITADVMWMIGMYIAEGSVSGGRTVNFALHSHETKYQQKLIAIFEQLGFRARLDIRDDKPNSAWVSVHSTALAEWLTDLVGVGCANKHFPEGTRYMDSSLVDALIQGIYDGDGKKIQQHRGERDDIEQTSLVLALEMAEWGIRQNRPVTASYYRRDGKKDVYRIYGATRDWPYSKSKANTWMVDKHECVRVKSIDVKQYDGLVYNLEVAGNHTYTVENLYVHNCQHPNRLFIEQQLVRGRSYSAIARSVPPHPDTGKVVDRRSVKHHYEEHMDLDNAVIRGVLEEEAQLLGQNIEEGLVGAFSTRGALNVLIRKAYDDAMNGITTVEPRDMIQMIKLFQELDAASSTKIVEEAKASVAIFMASIQNVFADMLEPEQAKELSDAIVAEVRRLREQNEVEAEIENHLRQLPNG